MIFALIAAAYVTIGAFTAGALQAEDAPEVVAITFLYPFFPVMMLGAWVRAVVHDRRR